MMTMLMEMRKIVKLPVISSEKVLERTNPTEKSHKVLPQKFKLDCHRFVVRNKEICDYCDKT